MFFWDFTYVLLIPAILLSMFAQIKVSSTFSKYSSTISSSGLTGAQAAQRLLGTAGIYDVRIEHVRGSLTDHYDPLNKVLRLSDSVYNSRSVAALGVAAHETGHAIQHNKGYIPLSVRNAVSPVVSIGNKLSWPLICIGLMFGFLSGSTYILTAGILLFAFIVLFQIITLPVEFNASSRAVKILVSSGILTNREAKPVRSVLSAAALTYVAAAFAGIMNLLRLLLILSRRRD